MVQIYGYSYILEMTDYRSSFALEMPGIIRFTKKLLKDLNKIVYEN